MSNVKIDKNLNNLELCVAEVISVHPYDTYKHISSGDNKNLDKLFTVYARIDGIVNKPIIQAKPLTNGIKKIPLIGELILTFKLNSDRENVLNQEQWFYISIIDLNSSINHNSLPGYTDTNQTQNNDVIGQTIEEKIISPLQPYEGDLLIEGRWGNSIRVGSTVKNTTDTYTIKPDLWIGNVGDPITILSNGRKNKDSKQFIIESPETCASSIYLTSTQKLTKLKLNNKLQIGESESAFAGSQIVGFADRIVLKAKTDTIILDSKTGIEINSPLIKVGVSDKKEPLLHSTATMKLLKTLIRVVNSGVVDSSGVICTPIDKSLKSPAVRQAIEQLTNNKVLFDKHINAK
jgi:hypothetical protein